MESIGQKLKAKREELGFSIDQVARDTNIAKSYLIALEDEHFEEFPGETYLVGFLRNYSEYLGLNSEEVISLYKSFKIQEQPIPMDELIVKPRVPLWLTVLLIVLGIGAVGAGGVFLAPELLNRGPEEIAGVTVPEDEAAGGTEEAAVASEEIEPSRILVMDEDILEQRFDQGDVIRFSKGDESFDLSLEEIDSTVTISSRGNSFILALGQEEMLDLDESGDPDIYVLVRDIDGAAGVLRLDRQVVPLTVSGETGEPAAGDLAVPQSGETEGGTDAESVETGSTSVASREREPLVILREQNQAPYTITIQFRGYCLFRYEIDDKDRVERYFKKDDVLRLDALRQVRVWLSNAGNADARIGRNEVVFGKPGEVSAGFIHWQTRDGVNELILEPVY